PPLAEPRPGLNAPAGQAEPADGARPPLPKRKPPIKGTMIGVAPPILRPGGPPPRPAPVPAPDPEPDPFGSLDLPDLPLPAAAPRAQPTPPQGSPPLPRPGAPRAASQISTPKPPPEALELNLPAAGKKQSRGGDEDLPAVVAFAAADLPMVVRPNPN